MDKDRTDCLSLIGLARRSRAGALRLTAPAGLNRSSARPKRGDQPRHPCGSAIRLARLSAGRSVLFCLSPLRSHAFINSCWPAHAAVCSATSPHWRHASGLYASPLASSAHSWRVCLLAIATSAVRVAIQSERMRCSPCYACCSTDFTRTGAMSATRAASSRARASAASVLLRRT